MFQLQLRCPVGIEDLLEAELLELGAQVLRRTHGGVFVRCSLQTLYHLVLWSRLASRVLLHLASVPSRPKATCIDQLTALPWEQWLSDKATLRIKAQGTNDWLRNSYYGMLCCKDAIVDRFKSQHRPAPTIDTTYGNSHIHVIFHGEEAHLWLDVGGGPLYQRNLRILPGQAALQENLAAALLLRAGFQPGQVVVDPMCGTGVLLLEAALLMTDQAPGLMRESVGWSGWQEHQPALWQAELERARERRRLGLKQWPLGPYLYGFDQDAQQIRLGQQAFARAGLEHLVQWQQRSIEQSWPKEWSKPHIDHIVTNPPFGERMGEQDLLPQLYRRLGQWCQQAPGGVAHILLAERAMGHHLGLRAHKIHAIWQGKAKRFWLHLPIAPSSQEQDSFSVADSPSGPTPSASSAVSQTSSHQDKPTYVTQEERKSFQQRLKKNLRLRQTMAKQQQLDCYRLYDADLPQFAAAIDCYKQWLILQEYAPPAMILPEKTAQRREVMLACLAEVFQVPQDNIIYKLRGSGSQDVLQGAQGSQRRHIDKCIVQEGALRFWVDVANYLDTGLFLDQRLFRRYLQETSQGKQVLNLFGYTGAASVAAALGGAQQTTTIDWSTTYLHWASENFRINQIPLANHRLIAADVRRWLEEQTHSYDSIILGPPSFSRSKRSQQVFVLQTDHAPLIEQCMAHLRPQGTLYFLTHARGFQLAHELGERYVINNRQQHFCPPDFRQAKVPLQLYTLTHGPRSSKALSAPQKQGR